MYDVLFPWIRILLLIDQELWIRDHTVQMSIQQMINQEPCTED